MQAYAHSMGQLFDAMSAGFAVTGTLTAAQRRQVCPSMAFVDSVLAGVMTRSAALPANLARVVPQSIEGCMAQLAGVFAASGGGGGGDTTPPTVSLTAPAAGTVSGPVTVSATASDAVGVVGVQFLLDGSPLGAEDTTAPYSITWDTTTTTNGSHTIAARARDAAGNQTTSAGVTVTVNNAAGGSAPVFVGPDLTAISVALNGTLPSIDMSQRFTGATSYALVVEPQGAPPPAGISINASTGLLTIAPTARGQTVMAVSASNAAPDTTESNYIQVVIA